MAFRGPIAAIRRSNKAVRTVAQLRCWHTDELFLFRLIAEKVLKIS
jgi:hypothetical protein